MYYQQPQTHQPYATAPPKPPSQQWMVMPVGVVGCPPGLEYLSQIDQVLVHQQVELFEAFTGIHAKNKFALKNSLGQQCYFAHEESETCMRICCEAERGFSMHVLDNAGNEVMRVTRPFKCCGGCCWCANAECCSHEVTVEAPVGQVVGKITQSQSFWVPYYDVRDAGGNKIFKIKGPCCVCPGPCCTCDFPFEIFTLKDGDGPIGCISKQYGGLVKEMFTNATNFSVTFPMDLDVKLKATLLGATFLIKAYGSRCWAECEISTSLPMHAKPDLVLVQEKWDGAYKAMMLEVTFGAANLGTFAVIFEYRADSTAVFQRARDMMFFEDNDESDDC